MDSRDADVVEVFDVVAHEFGGHDGFFGNGDVAGSRGNHGDGSFAVGSWVALQHDRSRQFAVFGGAYFLLDCGELFFVGVRGQDVAAMLGQPRENLGDLRRSLAFSEDHFGHAGAEAAMVIDLGKAQIFERQMAQAVYCLVGRELAVADLLEEFADGFGVHGGSSHSAKRLLD